MFKRSEYQQRLADIGLTEVQTEKLRAVLEEMMTPAARKANQLKEYVRKCAEHPFLGDREDQLSHYYQGKTDGINAVDRFLRGDMDAHDEFEAE